MTAPSEQREAALERYVRQLRAAISWVERPFIDDETPIEQLRKRCQFCAEDAERADIAFTMAQEPTE
jgi:hypothetical protein